MNKDISVSSFTMAEMKEELHICFEIILGCKIPAAQLDNLARECFQFHGKLYKYKFRDLFSHQAAGHLKGMENREPAPTSLFIQDMKKSFFANPNWPAEAMKKQQEEFEKYEAEKCTQS